MSSSIYSVCHGVVSLTPCYQGLALYVNSVYVTTVTEQEMEMWIHRLDKQEDAELCSTLMKALQAYKEVGPRDLIPERITPPWHLYFIQREDK